MSTAIECDIAVESLELWAEVSMVMWEFSGKVHNTLARYAASDNLSVYQRSRPH